MKNRNPIAVALLTLVTFGIYGIYWSVVTKGEMNERGAEIPTAWLIIVPLVNIWWLWKYSEGVEKVTAGKLSGVLTFILLWVLGPIGSAIVQDSFNNNVSGAPVATAPATETPSEPTAPAEDAVPPTDTTPPPATDTTPPVDQTPTNPVQG